jgi:hypothetical protein
MAIAVVVDGDDVEAEDPSFVENETPSTVGDTPLPLVHQMVPFVAPGRLHVTLAGIVLPVPGGRDPVLHRAASRR